jgi:hypothetical protein
MPDADDDLIDWPAVVDRLEAVVAERGLEREPGARAALAFARRCAIFGEPGPHKQQNDPLLAFCRAHGLSLDAIVLGHR